MQTNPEYINSTDHTGGEYLFLWLVKIIKDHQGTVLSGLYKGLYALRLLSHQDNQINLFFSDGTGVFAYTNNIDPYGAVKHVMAYKISRTVDNICSYQIRSCKANPGIEWTVLKEHSLYYFPTQGAMQVFINIDCAQYADVHFRPVQNWACFSILAYRQD